jgi:7-cyano-7-deazaguanine synthase
VLLSGGIDSATCLYIARKKGYGLHALTMAFHRIARGEVNAARGIASSAGVKEHRIVDLPDLREAGDMPGRPFRRVVPSSYIPQRNTIFYGIAASFAEEVGADCIVGGHNSDDQSVFDDTGELFFRNLQRAIWAGSSNLREKKTMILRPLRRMTKPEVVRLAVSLGVPLELTWSCHREATIHCWKCDGCRARSRSFKQAGVRDPLASVPGRRSAGEILK